MRVCLIQLPNPVLEDPMMQTPLGLLYLGAALKESGFDVYIADMRSERKLNTALIPRGYDFYGVTATTGEYSYAEDIGRWLKKREEIAMRVIGGPHVTHKPMETLEDTEYEIVCIGEGERTIVELAEERDLHTINGIAFKDKNEITITQSRDFIKDLDSIPFPARDLLPYDHVFTRDLYYGARGGYGEVGTVLMTERGCPMQCAYCANWDRKQRVRSVPNIVKEIEECKEVYNCRRFKIIDDEFGMPKWRVFDMCEAFEALDIQFRAQTRVDVVTPEMLRAFKKAGCDEIAFGIETPDEQILKLIRKKQTLEECKNAVKWAKEAGLRVKTLFMICLPGETWASVDKLKQFVQETKPDMWTLSTCIPYPGCDIEQNPEKYGCTIKERDYSKYWLYHDVPIFETNVASIDELKQHRTEAWNFLNQLCF